MEAALGVAAEAWADRGRLCTLDLLGESVTRPEQAEASEVTYLELIDRIAEDARFEASKGRPSVSLKPSAFTAGRPEDAFSPIRRVLERAKERGVAVTIDMEDRRWTDLTLERAVQFFEAGFDVGTVLQSRLFRTEADLERIPAGMRVRLVIGIYPEPGDVALTDKAKMKAQLVPFAQRLIERGARVELGTHDDRVVERFVAEVAPVAPDRCELQVLLGVPRDKLLSRLESGQLGPKIPVRIYVPFATNMSEATAYLRRRMDESPNLIGLVLRNLVERG